MTESTAPNRQALEVVLGHALQIPSAPDLLPLLMNCLSDPHQGGEELAELIEMDPGIASATLRLANSSWFGGRGQCDNLKQAVFLLGAAEVFRLTATNLSMRWMAAAEVGWEPGDFCRHSLSVAIASRLIAKELPQSDEMRAYTAGLMHDIGKLALAHAVPDRLAEVREHQIRNGGSWRMAERSVLGFDHTDVGGALMDKWGFPQSLIAVAHFYHAPSDGPVEFADLLAAVHAGKHLAVSLGIGVGEEGFMTELDGSFLQRVGFDESLGERILPALCDELTKVLGGSLYMGHINLGEAGPPLSS